MWFVIALLGCKSDTGLVGDGDPVELPEPKACIAVDPPSIDFGEQNPAIDAPQTRIVTVRSTCEADLEIHGVSLDDPSAPFDLGTIGSIVLSPGSSTDFTVTFDPFTAGDAQALALVSSNDPDSPEATVDLTGRGIAPVIELTPGDHDFGTPYIGCDLDNTWTVRNTGTADLTVSAYDFVSPSAEYTLLPAQEPPYTLVPGAQTTVAIEFLGLTDVDQAAFFTVASNDPRSPEVTVEATAAPRPYRSEQDSWEQAVRTGADILFVVDNSCSMSEEQTSLADNFERFVSTLTAADSDWQLAVVTTDDSTFQGPMITRNSADPLGEFQAQAQAGTAGSADERGLQIADLAVAPGGDAGPGSAFWRDEATLSVVILSDEEDYSTEAPATYVSRWIALKDGAADLVKVHAIAGDVPTPPCSTAAPAARYLAAVEMSGGEFVSICASDWGVNLEAVALGSIAQMHRFPLSAPPVPPTIEVRVDGVRQTSGWIYEEAGSAVKFDSQRLPPGGSLVQIDYDVMPDCDQ